MKQIVSDKWTLYIHGLTSNILAILLWSLVYYSQIGPNYSGVFRIVIAGVLAIVALFVAVSIVGAAMWVLNLLFYWVQVYRHGTPTEQYDYGVDDGE